MANAVDQVETSEISRKLDMLFELVLGAHGYAVLDGVANQEDRDAWIRRERSLKAAWAAIGGSNG